MIWTTVKANDYGNEANFDYVNWKEKIVESQEDDFDEGILGALLVNKDNQVSGAEGVMTEKILDENIRKRFDSFI